ncbi:MAG: response regulator transcription factor [Dermatophilaceae bacterium]
MTRILIVEDDPHVASFVAKGLHATGFVADVIGDGAAVLLELDRAPYDLMILDMGLPGADGLDVLRRVRESGNVVPVIVLTGNTDRDAVACLEAGADDYMRKPFHFGELLARVRARLRDSRAHDSTSLRLQVGAIHLDLRTRRARVAERDIDLTSREFALLETFMRHPDQVLTREQLLSQVWGYSFDPGSNLVNVYVNTLRKKLGQDVFETVRGAGYRMRR